MLNRFHMGIKLDKQISWSANEVSQCKVSRHCLARAEALKIARMNLEERFLCFVTRLFGGRVSGAGWSTTKNSTRSNGEKEVREAKRNVRADELWGEDEKY